MSTIILHDASRPSRRFFPPGWDEVKADKAESIRLNGFQKENLQGRVGIDRDGFLDFDFA